MLHPRTARFHRPELDLLRFAAFFLVFLHHVMPHATANYTAAGIPHLAAQALASFARAGGYGVDLFFALSAYLITELLLRERRVTGTIHIQKFYARRILRIWPLYFVALLILAPLLGLVSTDDPMPVGHLLGYILLSGNWVSAAWGYPASAFALLWSVSIEEQFYLAWPWLMKRFAERLGAMIALMFGIAWATRIFMAWGGFEHPGVWCNTLARLDPIAGGAYLAYWLNGRGAGVGYWVRWMLGGAGLLILVALAAVGGLAGWPGVYTYPMISAACLGILYATLAPQNEQTRAEYRRSASRNGERARAVGGYLGKISFGLYVMHVALIRLTELASGNALPYTATVALAFLGTLLAAAFSYQFIETPFLRLKERFAVVASRPV